MVPSSTASRSSRSTICTLGKPRAPICVRRFAFSLVELIIVVMIIGIFSAVAAPRFVDSLVFYRVESAARRVKADLELARQTARLTSASQSITFVNQTYTMSAGVADLNSSGNPYAVDLVSSPYEINDVAVDFGGTSSVAFDGYGMPSSGGTVVITGPHHQCTVTLNGTTGQITISRVSTGNRAPE
ncbi:MAG: GspH/FimT family pseudopilin [Pirellulales bacterium]